MKNRGRLLSVSESEDELSASVLYLDPAQKGLKCPEFPWKEGKGLGPSEVRAEASEGEGTDEVGVLDNLWKKSFLSHVLG